MKKRRGILLASFLDSDDEEVINREVNFIVNHMQLTNDYIFLLRNVEHPAKKIITYNCITTPGTPFHPSLYTLRVHRKKATNTLYTINGLNAAVAEEHSGQIGKHLSLSWDKYRDSLLLTAGKKLQVHPIEVMKIFKIEDPPEEN